MAKKLYTLEEAAAILKVPLKTPHPHGKTQNGDARVIALTWEGIDHMDPFTRHVALELVQIGEAEIIEEEKHQTREGERMTEAEPISPEVVESLNKGPLPFWGDFLVWSGRRKIREESEKSAKNGASMTAAIASREVWIAYEKESGMDGLTEWAGETGRIVKEESKKPAKMDERMTETIEISRESIEALNKKWPLAGDFLLDSGRVKIREESRNENQ